MVDSTPKCNTEGGIDGESAHTVFAPTNHPLLKESTTGMLYSQLTEGKRNQIYALKQEDISLRRIAVILGRDVSTIGRDIRRNRVLLGFQAKQANRKAQERRKTPRNIKMTPDAEEKLREEFSPEQISCTIQGRDSFRQEAVKPPATKNVCIQTAS